LLFVAASLAIAPNLLSQKPVRGSAKPSDWETKGRALMQAGRFKEAVELFHGIKRTRPKDPRPYFYSSLALMDAGDLTQAASELDEAVRLDPSKIEYRVFQASVSSRLGHHDRALKSVAQLTNAETVNKLTPAWMWLLADVYYRCQKPDDALMVLGLLGKRTPGDSKVDLNRGQAYLLKGQLQRARECFTQSIRKNSSANPVAYYEMGKLLHQLNAIPAAKEALLTAVKQAPHNPEYAYKLATVCLALNQDAEALRHLQRVESAGAEHPEIYYALARAWRKLGKPGDAAPYLKKFQDSSNAARKRAEQDREAGKLIALGEKELDRNNPAEARKFFEEALAVAPQDWTAHGYLAEMLLDSGELDQAYSHLVKMEEVDPDSVVGNYLMAKYWHSRHDFAQAKDYAERAKALRPANSELRNLMGNIYQGLRRYEDAVKEYEAALALAPDRKDFQQNLDTARNRLRSDSP
jgi:tetratricopeptide (TPR) repeat protein